MSQNLHIPIDAVKARRGGLSNKAAFIALNEKLPLTPLRTETDSNEAVEMIRYLERRFSQRKMPRAVREYLDWKPKGRNRRTLCPAALAKRAWSPNS